MGKNTTNVYCECGGIQMTSNGFGLEKRSVPVSSEDLTVIVFEWYEFAIKSFGTERCMFESNYPVDKECVTYRTLWNCFKRIANKMALSEAEKSNIFKGTAVKVYGLDL